MTPSFSSTASLVADPTRAVMLTALLDGRALPAGELAQASGVSPQTASSHLQKLLTGGLIAVETEGRHRYYRLAGAHVAHALEALGAVRPSASVRQKALSPEGRRLRFCRCCYDHLAGQVGVAVTEALEREGCLVRAAEKRFAVMREGIAWFAAIGLDVEAIEAASRRGLARRCLDCSERRHHLAGPLGSALLRKLYEAGWLRRANGSRAVDVTPKGRLEFKRRLDLDLGALTPSREAVLAARFDPPASVRE